MIRLIALALLVVSARSARAASDAFVELLGAAAREEAPAVPDVAGNAVRPPPESGRRAAGIGLSHSGDPFDIPDFKLGEVARLLREAGGTHYRPHLPLKEAMPGISASDLRRLERAAADPAVLEAMIAELALNGRWGRMDSLVESFETAGIRLILVVGAGYRKESPLFADSSGNMIEASPDRLGRERYVTMLRWIVGAAVRRYGARVKYWQVENEINLARAVTSLGWRVKEKSWGDAEYCKRLISALAETVHAEGARQGRSLKTTHNFAVDLPWKGHLGQPRDIAKDFSAFSSDGDLDILGIDLYANHFTGWPILDRKMEWDVRRAVSAAGGRPVWVLETGFATGPAQRGYTSARQAKYFHGIFDKAYGAGADLVLAFGWFWNPRGWYTDRDKPLPWWHPMAPEQYWSPVRGERGPDGSMTPRFEPAWDAFREAADKWVGGR